MTPIFIKTFKTAISSWFYNCGQALSVILHLVNFYAVLTFCFQVSKTWTNSAFNICIQLLIVYVLIARAAHRSACRSAQSVLAYWFFIDFIFFCIGIWVLLGTSGCVCGSGVPDTGCASPTLLGEPPAAAAGNISLLRSPERARSLGCVCVSLREPTGLKKRRFTSFSYEVYVC